tara:strand:- start:9745 stop:10728 length:984 start_codon:yes stop_codon:yes gene_type:complete
MNLSILKKSGIKNFKLKQIRSDASFRKYFRINIRNDNRKLLLVNSPNKTENNLGYLNISNILKKMNLSVPEIINYDISKGSFLIEDFGINTYTYSLKKGENEKKLYNLATEVLIHINKCSKNLKSRVPIYSSKKLINEALLFLEWYWPIIHKKKAKKKILNEYIFIWKKLLKNNLKTNKILVHRDFHIDNLFFLNNRKKIKACGLIDFQDSVIGPSTYDLVSLLEDARRDVNEEIKKEMFIKYLKKIRIENKKNFLNEYKVLSLNRHLKVIGIFTRLFLRDSKKSYLKHIPRIWNLIEKNSNLVFLNEINEWLNKYFPKNKRITPKK